MNISEHQFSLLWHFQVGKQANRTAKIW